jgi:hypothetical protein
MGSARLRGRAIDLWPVVRAIIILGAVAAWITGVAKTIANGTQIAWPWAWGAFVAIWVALVLTAVSARRRARTLGIQRKWWLVAARMILLIGVPLTGVLVVLYLPFSNRVDWTLVLVAIGIVGLWPISAEFSRPTLRAAAAAFVLGSLVLLLYVGNAAIASDHAKQHPRGSHPATSSSSVIDVLRAGGNALVQRVPGVSTKTHDVTLQTPGWVLLAVLALLWYRALEIRGMKHGIGPVKIEAGDSLKGDDDRATVGGFTVAVLQNVPEPGSTPGSQTTTTVTDIIAAAPDPTRVIEKALESVLSVIRPSARYRVVVDYLEPNEDEPDRHIGVARIFDARTGYSLETIREADESKRKALRAVAYATAGWILERSDRVPSWGAWSRDSSRALAIYMENTTGSAPKDEAARERSVRELRHAQVEAPRSGVLTVLAAHELDQSGEHTDAMELYVRAGVVHRRYLAARYRTAVGLHILASHPDEYWWRVPAGTRSAIVHGLRRLDRELRLGTSESVRKLEIPVSSSEWQQAISTVAESHLSNLDDSYAWWSVAVNLLRRDERMFWWKLLRNRSRHRDRLMIEIACRAMHDRASPDRCALIEVDVERDRCWGCGRALYNLACWYLSQDPVSHHRASTALELLEQARDEPDGRYLRRTWLAQDPDLQPLQSDRRFDALLKTLNQ